MRVWKGTLLAVGALTLLLAPSACGRSDPPASPPRPATPDRPAPPPPTPRAPAPTIQVSASPNTIERGRQTTLAWNSSNASSVVIEPGVGNVGNQGSVVVSPLDSTTYTAEASGAGGDSRDSVRVTVLRPPEPDIETESIEDQFRSSVNPVFFDYDRSEIRADARGILERNARWLRDHSEVSFLIEGHCDERGTEEYNLALGDRRAQAARDYLVELGIRASRIETVSFGEERPFDPGTTERAYAQNRRAHFRIKR